MVEMKIVNVSPEIAKKLLEANTNNYRGINHRRVEMYAREMREGLWQENYEPIHIYEGGRLANGQHRLTAIVESGATVKMLVVAGVERDVNLFDRGGLRTNGQILKASGVSLAGGEISAVSILKNGFHGTSGAEEIKAYHSKLNDFDVVSFAILKGKNHPILRKAGIIAATYCAYRLNRITLDEIEQFATVCNSGIPTEGVNSYPPLCFRRTLQSGFKNANGETISSGEGMRKASFETAFRALVDFHNGAKRKLNYRPDGEGDKILESARKVYGR